MTSDEKKQLRDKYNRTQRIDGLPFNAVCNDVNGILDALPDSPRNQHFRGKYVEQSVDHSITYWLVCDDIAVMLDDIVPVDPPAPVGKKEIVDVNNRIESAAS